MAKRKPVSHVADGKWHAIMAIRCAVAVEGDLTANRLATTHHQIKVYSPMNQQFIISQHIKDREQIPGASKVRFNPIDISALKTGYGARPQLELRWDFLVRRALQQPTWRQRLAWPRMPLRPLLRHYHRH